MRKFTLVFTFLLLLKTAQNAKTVLPLSLPTLTHRPQSLSQAIKSVAAKNGLCPNRTLKHAFLESGLNPMAHRKNSRFFGLFQIDTVYVYQNFCSTMAPTFSIEEQTQTFCNIINYYKNERGMSYDDAILAFGMGEVGLKNLKKENKNYKAKFKRYLE